MSDSQIIVRVPDSSVPGHLRRRIAISEFFAELDEMNRAPADNTTNHARWVKFWNHEADVLSEFVTVSDGSDPRAAILGLSKDDLDKIWDALRGSTNAPPLVLSTAPVPAVDSGAGSKAKARSRQRGR